MSLLAGAYARLERIEAKHTEFRERADEWVNSPEGKSIADRYLEQRATVPSHKQEKIPADVPPILGIIAGEAIYNLRSALDYLAHELVFLNEGAYFDFSQFPIDDDPTKIPRFSADTLKRLRPCDRTALVTLQPYKGCKWTARLRNLSNPDKHRKLTLFDVGLAPVFHILSPVTGTECQVTASDLYVQRDVQFTIGFDSAGPVAQTLDLLHAEITDVLDAFNPEFEAQGL